MPIYCANLNSSNLSLINHTNNGHGNNNGIINHLSRSNFTNQTISSNNNRVDNKKQHIMVHQDSSIGNGTGGGSAGAFINHNNSQLNSPVPTGSPVISHHHNHHQNNHPSHHNHHHIHNSKNKNTSSLIMAINRFKNSVKNMKETVLIPTRLNDLSSPPPEPSPIPSSPPSLLTNRDQNVYELEDISEEILINGIVDDTDSLKTNDSQNSSADSLLDVNPIINNAEPNSNLKHQTNVTSVSNSTTTTCMSLNNQNLYEQFKLLDLIDKILSSDTISTMVSLDITTRSNGGFIMENNDNNNNPKQHHRRSCRFQEENNGINGSKDVQDEEQQQIKNSDEQHSNYGGGKYHRNTKQILHRQFSSSSSSSSTSGNGSFLSNSSIESINSVTDLQQQNCADHHHSYRFGQTISDCSLLKIKEKLEYHLISLKNILNMMSDGAEYITNTYLEDIQSGEDRFEKKRDKSFTDYSESISTRHYYTSN